MVQFVDLKDMIERHGEHMPTDAHFYGVSIVSAKYHPIYDM